MKLGSGAGAEAPAPLLVFDHVQIAVADLAAAAVRLLVDHGLRSLAGGRHPGRGTANRIIPLGECYLELITIADEGEAAHHPASGRVVQALAESTLFPVWVARVDGLAAERERLQRLGLPLPPLTEGSRTKPDGSRLEWRMQELVAQGEPSPLPFLIEWRVPAEQYPGWLPQTDPQRRVRFRSLLLSDPAPARAQSLLCEVLKGHAGWWSVEEGEPGVREVALAGPGGPVRLS